MTTGESFDGPFEREGLAGGQMEFVPINQADRDRIDALASYYELEAERDLALNEIVDGQTNQQFLGSIGLSTEIDRNDDEDDGNETGRGGGNYRPIPPPNRPLSNSGAIALELPEQDDRRFAFSGSGPRPILH